MSNTALGLTALLLVIQLLFLIKKVYILLKI